VGEGEDHSGVAPAELLQELGSRLAANPANDTGLVTILATHILTALPKPDAVAAARQAIIGLAAERAARQQKGA